MIMKINRNLSIKQRKSTFTSDVLYHPQGEKRRVRRSLYSFSVWQASRIALLAADSRSAFPLHKDCTILQALCLHSC